MQDDPQDAAEDDTPWIFGASSSEGSSECRAGAETPRSGAFGDGPENRCPEPSHDGDGPGTPVEAGSSNGGAPPAPTDESAGGDSRPDPGSGPIPTPVASGTATDDPAPGSVLFGKYQVLGPLGRGGMATVLRVRHLGLDDERALKLIRSSHAYHPQARARFRREARAMARFSHPHAVAVHDADARDGEPPYIEMEYVRGRNFVDVLCNGGPMSLDCTARILEQLCGVLQKAHERGIVHRDLKPSNLMLLDGCPPGEECLKVLDFGVAKILEAEVAGPDAEGLTEQGQFMGTSAYASPEQIIGHSRLDRRSDLYSVGVILYEFLTGKRPFGGSQGDMNYHHCHTPAPRFQERNPDHRVPPAVEQVVLRCLAKDPAARPQTAEELAREFSRACAVSYLPPAPEPGDDPPSTITSPRPSTTSRRALTSIATVPRRRWVAAVAVISFGALILTTARALRPSTGERTSKQDAEANGAGASEPIRRQLERWRLRGYLPDPPGSERAGWPPALVHEVDGLRFIRTDRGTYLPAGYHPGPQLDPDDGWPLTLIRTDDAVEFIRIAGAPFRMGNLKGVVAGPNDPSLPAHRVTVSGFYIQKYEVSNQEIEQFFAGINPALQPWTWKDQFVRLAEWGAEEAGRHPAVGIPWQYANAFAISKNGRLPTEAQWEFAARSRGKENCYVWGCARVPDPLGPRATIRQAAHIDAADEDPRGTKPIGSFEHDKTDQGVMDMTGNVREWCRDVFLRYQEADRVDPQFPPDFGDDPTPKFVVRGGSFRSSVDLAHTTNRSEPREVESKDVGFRIVLECPEVAPDPSRQSAGRDDRLDEGPW